MQICTISQEQFYIFNSAERHGLQRRGIFSHVVINLRKALSLLLKIITFPGEAQNIYLLMLCPYHIFIEYFETLGLVLQWMSVSPYMQYWHPMRMPGYVPAAPLSIQFFDNSLGKTVEDG